MREFPQLLARIIHPDYTGPSRWFGLAKFNEAFNPMVTLKLKADLLIRKEVLSAKAHFDAIHTYASKISSQYRDMGQYSIPEVNQVDYRD